jgi:hypothetical protein
MPVPPKKIFKCDDIIDKNNCNWPTKQEKAQLCGINYNIIGLKRDT